MWTKRNIFIVFVVFQYVAVLFSKELKNNNTMGQNEDEISQDNTSRRY